MGYVLDAYIPGQCRHPSLWTLNLENGTMMFRDEAQGGEPLRLRNNPQTCGVDAKWFELAQKTTE
jgi:hypothetical protein